MSERKDPPDKTVDLRAAAQNLAQAIENLFMVAAGAARPRTDSAPQRQEEEPSSLPSRAAEKVTSHLSQYFNVVNKYRVEIILIWVISVLIGLFVVAAQKPEYRATATIMLIGHGDVPGTNRDYVGWGRTTHEYRSTQVEIMKNRCVARAVIAKLGLMNHPEFAPQPSIFFRVARKINALIAKVVPTTKLHTENPPSKVPEVASPAEPEPSFTDFDFEDPALLKLVPLSLTNQYLNRIIVSPKGVTPLMDLTVCGSDPQLVTRIANAHAEAYIAYYQRRIKSAAKESETWLGNIQSDYSERLKRLRREMIEKEEQSDSIMFERFAVVPDIGRGVSSGTAPAPIEKTASGESVPQGHSIIGMKVAMAVENFVKAEAERARAQSLYEKLHALQQEGKPVDAFPTVRDDPLVASLRNQLAAARAEVEELKARYGERHPQVVKLQERVDAIAARVQKEIRAVIENIKQQYEVALAQEEWARRRLEEATLQAKELRKKEIEMRNLRREIAELERMVDKTFAGEMDASLIATRARANVGIHSRAEPPTRPSNVRNMKIIGFAAVLGLALGLGFAFFMDYWQKQLIKHPEDFEEVLDVRLLGTVVQKADFPLPIVHEGLVKEQSTGADVSSDVHRTMRTLYESFRRIRTSIIGLEALRGGHKAIMFTSTIPQEGKSCISANVAASLAASGRKVLLIDADVRRPSLHHLFESRTPSLASQAPAARGLWAHFREVWDGMMATFFPTWHFHRHYEVEGDGESKSTERPGLKTLLAGRHSLQEVIQSTSVENLHFIPSGSLGEHSDISSSALLETPRLAEIIEEAKKIYDFVMIDTPPVGSVTDPLLVASCCDGVIWVVACNRTPRRHSRKCLRDMRDHGANVLGAIGNMFTQYDSYGYYDYRYYYYYDSEGRKKTRRRVRKLIPPETHPSVQ